MIRDSLSEYCSISSSCSAEDSCCNQEVWDFVPPRSSLPPAEPAGAQHQAFTVLPAWGDVLVIEMQSDPTNLKGCVKAVLSPPRRRIGGPEGGGAGFQTLRGLWLPDGEPGVVSGRLEVLGPHELDVFYRTSEELSRLEFGRRRNFQRVERPSPGNRTCDRPDPVDTKPL
ncbi:hypothetical protein OJAV_G00027480 [Oryzias javanicus]|uniref:Uncharacterized protein n=1 Tax=Oryzias javanicus TaxID=123683 RepID=A0A437DJ73_ORYJA|nr:hypothetical protein OJAV_G00027480 [Oryzias javanicus]